jgi:hypothetical protein
MSVKATKLTHPNLSKMMAIFSLKSKTLQDDHALIKIQIFENRFS